MVSSKTLLLTTAAVAFAATEASVTLYDGTFFQGEAYNVPFNLVNSNCANVGAFNDRASSATWNLGSEVDEVVFYENAGCRGNNRSWSAGSKNFPNNFAIDGIDNMVSSVRLTSKCSRCNRSPVIAVNGATENATVVSVKEGNAA